MSSRISLVLAVVCAVLSTTHANGQDSGRADGAELERPDCAPRIDRARVHVPAGSYTLGAGARYAEEGGERVVETDEFWIDRFEVTNAEFAAFVDATDYVTVAERAPDPADHPDIDPVLLTPGSAVFGADPETGFWWSFVEGADWRAPVGPGSDIAARADYPVVHVAYEDAAAFAAWLGADLPSETEWEIAARGGLEGATYGWGERFRPDGEWRANVWQGAFPVIDTGEDGFAGLAPAGCYMPNDYGAYDMIGNVWEWTQSPFDETGRTGVIRGGSYLCSSSYCARFRPAARQPQEWDFSASHIGFRTVIRTAPTDE